MSAFQKKPAFDFKTQYGLGLDPQDDEIMVDFFCGGGGAGTGLELGLGRPVTVAKNHNPAAISMHTANHLHARHYTTDVFEGDPDEECGGRPIGWFHMSPDCTHHSQAVGGQPRKREIRNLSWVGLKWAGKKPGKRRIRVISLENVKQILQWGPPIAKRDKATGRVIKLDGTVAAAGERVPVQQQFLVPDPKRRGITWRRFVQLLEGMGYQVESCADRGELSLISPVMITAAHGQGRPGGVQRWGDGCKDASIPLGTVTASGGHAVATAFMAQMNGCFNTIDAKDIDEPMTTVTNTGSQQQLVTANLVHLRGNCDARDAAEPLHTISAGGTHHGLMTAFMERQFGASVGQTLDDPAPTITAGGGGKSSLVELQLSPEVEAGALRVAAFLFNYYGTENTSECSAPAPTITTKDRLALVTVMVMVRGTPYVIVDICLRMLQPHELYRAQGFPADYIIDKGAEGKPFTKTEQVHMCGNSVSPPPMSAIARANDPWVLDKQQQKAA